MSVLHNLRPLAEKWRDEAQRLRTLEAHGQAAALEQAAKELEAAIGKSESYLLTVREAAVESGYSEDHLRSLVREGVLPDGRAEGSSGEIRIERRHLPRKPGLAARTRELDVDFASRVAARRKEAAHG